MSQSICTKPSGTSQGLCTGTFRNLTRYLPRNPPEPHHASWPRPSGTSSGICTGTLRNITEHLHGNFGNLTRYLHQNFPEPHKVSAPERSGTAQNPPQPQQVSSPEPRYLHRNPPEPHGAPARKLREPHKVSAPELSGTSQGICTGTLRNGTEPSAASAGIFTGTEVSAPEPSGTSRGICTRTLRNLVRNLVLKLRRTAPELTWAKDAIVKFCCWGTMKQFRSWLVRGWHDHSFLFLEGDLSPFLACNHPQIQIREIEINGHSSLAAGWFLKMGAPQNWWFVGDISP